MRRQQVTIRGILIATVCAVAIAGITVMRLSEAQGRQPPSIQLAAATAAATAAAGIPATFVSADARRALAGTCEGYNLELEHAAGIAQRTGNQAEAARLMGLRQGCGTSQAAQRSAR